MGWWWVITKRSASLSLVRSGEIRTTKNLLDLRPYAVFSFSVADRNVRAALDLRNLLAGRRVLLGALDLT